MSDYADQTVAVLAVQGAFAEHEARLSELGARCIEMRQAADLQQNFDRLVLPGGESTVQASYLPSLVCSMSFAPALLRHARPGHLRRLDSVGARSCRPRR